MERHPSLYEGKDEEAIRDSLMMVLVPNFESVSGETFNKSGKTDILVRHEGKNLYVAECKFWSGQAAHQKTIDQILGYLTWRDSRAAILYFVDNQNLDPVLQQISPATAQHKCFIKELPKASEGWHNFDFRLANDPTRSVQLAIICFHFPKSKT